MQPAIEKYDKGLEPDTASSLRTGETFSMSEPGNLGQAQCHSFKSNSSKCEGAVEGSDDVLLNISPKKFEKKKDQLFIDFFSMYTKRFVKDQKQKSKQKFQIKLEGQGATSSAGARLDNK